MKLGDLVPPLTFLNPDDTEVSLGKFLGKPLLMIFLRHLAWIACRAHLGEVEKIYSEIKMRGGEILVISFTPPKRIRSFLEKHPQPFPIVSDPTLSAYKTFSLERTRVGSFFNLGVIYRYLKQMVRGWWPEPPEKGEDLLQLGGDFILNREGRVVFSHPSLEPTDRPDNATLLKEIQKN